MLVPLARPILPSAVRVAGPGPIEPPKDAVVTGSKATPPIPGDADDLIEAASNGDHGDGEGEDELLTSAQDSGDPYAALDNAFGSGGYRADQPKAHADDDLLF